MLSASSFRNREKFRIYVVLPLLPGFDNVNAVQAVLYFIMRSITRGEASLFKRLEKEGNIKCREFDQPRSNLLLISWYAGVDPHEFITFFGMRAHDVLMGSLVSQLYGECGAYTSLLLLRAGH